MRPLGGFEVRMPLTDNQRQYAITLIQQTMEKFNVFLVEKNKFELGIEYVFGEMEIDFISKPSESESSIIGHFEEAPDYDPFELDNFTCYTVVTHLSTVLSKKASLPTIVESQMLGLNFAILEGRLSEFILDFWDYIEYLGRLQIAFRPHIIPFILLTEIDNLRLDQVHDSLERVRHLMESWSLHLSKFHLMEYLCNQQPVLADLDRLWRQIIQDEERVREYSFSSPNFG